MRHRIEMIYISRERMKAKRDKENTLQMFSVRNGPEKCENHIDHLDLCLKKTRAEKSHDFLDIVF